MNYLKQSTTTTIQLGPFLDSTDGVTAETALTISSTDVYLSKAGAAFANPNDTNAATHDRAGWYRKQLNATDTNTVGRFIVEVQESGALPVWREFMILPANVYDSLVGGTDSLEVDVTAVSGDTTAADNLELDYDGTGYAKANSTIGTVTTNTDMVSEPPTAATIADTVWDEQKAGHIVAGSFGEEVQAHAFSTEISALENLSAADVAAELATYDGPTKAEMDAGFAALNDATPDEIADQVWKEILADHSGGPGSTAEALDGASAPTAADVADAVWEEAIADHSGTAGSTAEALDGASAPTAAAVADAVWDETLADHDGAGTTGEALGAAGSAGDPWITPLPGAYGAGSAGNIVGNLNDPTAVQIRQEIDSNSTQLADILADTNELQTDNVPGLIAALNDLAGSEVAAAVWNALLTSHQVAGSFGEEVQAHALSSEIAGLNDLSAAEVAAELETYDGPTKTEMDAGLAALNDPTAVQIRQEIDSNSTQLADILADTNELQTDNVPGLIAALNDLAGSEVAAAVWNALLTSHQVAGSFGEEVQAHALSSEIAGLNDLSAAEVNAELDAAFTTQMADSVPADGTIATREQAIYMIVQYLFEREVAGTTVTVKKVDGATDLMTLTLDDGVSPTSVSRTT